MATATILHFGVSGHRALYAIAADIERHWPNVSPYAKPYLVAMAALNTIRDMYLYDDARSVVLYFLSNATSWRGDDARRLKAELKSMLTK